MEDMSEAGRMFAMLRWVKTVPRGTFRRVHSGTRESEQPSQRILGDWDLESVGRRVGVVWWVWVAQAALEARREGREEGFVVWPGGGGKVSWVGGMGGVGERGGGTGWVEGGDGVEGFGGGGVDGFLEG